jgi:hypothetical protein
MAGDERLLEGCEACPIMFVRDLGFWACEGGGDGEGKGKVNGIERGRSGGGLGCDGWWRPSFPNPRCPPDGGGGGRS